MSQCPICQTKYAEGAVAHCSTCGWDLTQYPLTPDGFTAQQQAKIIWAREIWQENQCLKPELSKYVSHEEKLVSSLGIDYKKLRDFLLKKRWRDADQETARLMFRAVGRERKSCSDKLDLKSLREFPCEELAILNSLWVKYSQGKFGFSVQNRIDKETEKNQQLFKHDISYSFEGKVGWIIGSNLFDYRYLNYNELTFDESAPPGHLPAFFIDWKIVIYTQKYDNYGDPPQRHHWLISNKRHLFSRCDECKIQS